MGSVHGRYENIGSSQQHICSELCKTEVGTSTTNELQLAQQSTASSPQAIAIGCGGCSRKLFRRATAAHPHPPARAFSSSAIRDASISKRSRQDSLRSMTRWHRPTTNAIFSSHFKESNRSDQIYVHHIVAEGSFGVVFKVCDKLSNGSNSDVSYALKVIKKSKIIEENSLQQIKDEVDIQKLCGHHPFIVKQFDLWQNRRNLHILSEYVSNGELLSKIDHFSIDLVRLYVAEIALAIDFLHNAGIIYRDAKPENILLTQQLHIKLTDFGLSKWLKLGSNTRTICGTLKYMAPEILNGEPYSHAVDWWALGIIVCQMLTQKSPNIGLNLQLPPQENLDGLTTNGCLEDNVNKYLLSKSVQSLSHEEQDLIRRLLVLESRQRIRSVMSLQRIGIYKDYKIETKRLLNISALDIIAKDKIQIHEGNSYNLVSNELANKAFQDF